jgi:hypothetical protein
VSPPSAAGVAPAVVTRNAASSGARASDVAATRSLRTQTPDDQAAAEVPVPVTSRPRNRRVPSSAGTTRDSADDDLAARERLRPDVLSPVRDPQVPGFQVASDVAAPVTSCT